MNPREYLLQQFSNDHLNGPNNHQLDLYNKALDDFTYQKHKSIMAIAYSLKKMDKIHDLMYDYHEDLKMQQAKQFGTLWLWITISPKKEVKFLDFKKKVEQIANRKMFKEHFYVFEQRSKEKETAGEGFHSHLLLQRDLKYKQNKIIKNLKNSCKHITNVENHDIFNFHWCPEEYLKDKMEYMTGTKTGDEKDEKQLIDIVFRQNYNLSTYYTNASIPKETIQKAPSSP